MRTKFRAVFVSEKVNSNKFWFADITGSQVLRRWGRVGYKGQSKNFEYSSPGEAARKTEDAYYGKLRKGYRELDLVDADANRIVSGASLESIALDQIDCNGSKELEKLIKFLVARNVHSITSKTQITYSDGQLKTPLGVVSPGSIRKARGILAQIAGYIGKGRGYGNAFARLVEQYMVYVPINVGMKLDASQVFRNQNKIQEQEDILDAMESLMSNPTPNPGDEVEQVFNVKMDKITDREEIGKVEKLFARNANRGHRSYGMKLKAVYQIEMNGQNFDDKVGNVRRLWHGTKASNLLSIMKGGMKIVPTRAGHTTGRMFGDGLYFSDQSTKALNYATTYWGGRDEGRYFMLLVDVAMGKSYTPDSSYENFPRRGYDSTHAKPGRSGVQNPEIIVYREAQARIKYLCEFTR